MNNINFKAGQNGLPLVKAHISDYKEQEKIKIAKVAKEYGLRIIPYSFIKLPLSFEQGRF